MSSNDINIGTVLDEKPNNLVVSPTSRGLECRSIVPAQRIDICTMLNQEPRHWLVSTMRRSL
jgi:hypothetical protein